MTTKREFKFVLLCTGVSIIGIFFWITLLNFIKSIGHVSISDIHGRYIVDRTHYSGKQADWQYNHFRFEITNDNEFYFHVTDNENIVETYKGKVTYVESYANKRIILHVDTPRHHIIEDMPTLYNKTWSFYYVFKSPKFGNVFFKKGKWKSISK